MPENVLVDWPKGGFSQLTECHITNGSLPPVNSAHIDGYFTLRMGIDSRAVGDSQALKKGRLLLQSNRVEACSILHQDKAFYFSGICRAAMKKAVSITTNVSDVSECCHGKNDNIKFQYYSFFGMSCKVKILPWHLVPYIRNVRHSFCDSNVGYCYAKSEVWPLHNK